MSRGAAEARAHIFFWLAEHPEFDRVVVEPDADDPEFVQLTLDRGGRSETVAIQASPTIPVAVLVRVTMDYLAWLFRRNGG